MDVDASSSNLSYHLRVMLKESTSLGSWLGWDGACGLCLARFSLGTAQKLYDS